MFVSVLGICLCGFVGPQPVAMVSFIMAVVGCLVAGFSGFVWFSHFVFLTFLGGLLVLFLYSTALAPCPGKLTGFRPEFGGVQVGWMVISVCVFWSLGSTLIGVSHSSSVGLAVWEAEGVYEEVDWFSGLEVIDFGWLSGWFLPVMGMVLFLCMISVTKMCGGLKVSLRRVVGGSGSWVVKKDSRHVSNSSFGNVIFPFRSLDEVPLR